MTKLSEIAHKPGLKTFCTTDDLRATFSSPRTKGSITVDPLSYEEGDGEFVRGWHVVMLDGSDNTVREAYIDENELDGIRSVINEPGEGRANLYITVEGVKLYVYPHRQTLTFDTFHGVRSNVIVEEFVKFLIDSGNCWEGKSQS